jgi:DNA (cytosine-5)-methyltransferase 1
MGVGDYVLDGARTNQLLSGFGDAVAAPVVEWLASHHLMPLLRGDLGAQEALERTESVG